MDQTICPGVTPIRHHDDAPFVDERRRYLHHCAERGATAASLKVKRNELSWIATRLDPDAREGIGMEELQRIAHERRNLRAAVAAARRVVEIGRPWLRFLGWWREPTAVLQYQSQLDQYVTWMHDERGFTLATVKQWGGTIGRFLRWCELTNRQLPDLRPEDVDEYFATQGKGRLSRVSVANTAAALRGFLRYAALQGLCADGLAASICPPRLYQQESLPYAPDWSDVQRMLADANTDKAQDIRDRAILLLIAVYGMRSGEVSALCLEQIHWAGRTLRLFRLKQRRSQIYPLVPSVAEALARYIDTVRPPASCPEVFLRMHAPRRPLQATAIYHVVNRRFVALGIKAAHCGGHALRHACARRLLAEGLSLKEIADHLGHRSTSATSIYAKVNMAALREVGAFDLGGLH